MDRTWISLLLGFIVSAALPGGCLDDHSTVSLRSNDSSLRERFHQIETGMGTSRLEEILGSPDRVIPTASEPDHRILIWRERWFGLPRATVVAKIEDDRLVIASYSSGSIGNAEDWIREIEARRPVRKIPGMILSEENRWASLARPIAPGTRDSPVSGSPSRIER